MRKGGDTIWNMGLACLAIFLGMAALTVDASSKSRTCRKLEARLATVSGGSPAQAKRYDRAIAKQTQQLKVLRVQMTNANCGFGLFSGHARECAGLKRSEGRMKSNLAKLQKQRSRIGGSSVASRRRIEASLKKHGCNSRQAPAKKEKTQKGAVKAKVKQTQRPGDVYQTMCVRLCDGYYFPISFSVSKKQFSRDAKTCEARCPGADVALFTHDVLRESPEDMVSAIDGTAYRELPNAFSYRRTGIRKNICGCQRAKNFTIVAGEKSEKLAGTPLDEQNRSEVQTDVSPKTELQKNSSFHIATTRKTETANEPENSGSQTPNGGDVPEDGQTPKRVRIVGPAFLPDPEEAIDLRAPVPAPAP